MRSFQGFCRSSICPPHSLQYSGKNTADFAIVLELAHQRFKTRLGLSELFTVTVQKSLKLKQSNVVWKPCHSGIQAGICERMLLAVQKHFGYYSEDPRTRKSEEAPI